MPLSGKEWAGWLRDLRLAGLLVMMFDASISHVAVIHRICCLDAAEKFGQENHQPQVAPQSTVRTHGAQFVVACFLLLVLLFLYPPAPGHRKAENRRRTPSNWARPGPSTPLQAGSSAARQAGTAA